MTNSDLYSSLYQINTRVRLTELSSELGRAATLDDIPDSALLALKDKGFDRIWFLSVWSTGAEARQMSLTKEEWLNEFRATLPDLEEADVGGSGFAITAYEVSPTLGGASALARLRKRMADRGLKLMLDFVPNHMAIDHPWRESHPEYLVTGTDCDLERAPQNYTRIRLNKEYRIFAYGRDPFFSGWSDTLQLDYSNPALYAEMRAQLRIVANQCDGVRCDMAMLIVPEVFERTWGRRPEAFWPVATKNVREIYPDFRFMAEVYWDMEWELQQQGFDFTYDKRLYDRLHAGRPREIREHFFAGLDYQNKLARFLENHDEPRAATAFDPDKHQAAALITFLSPGFRFFHQGQLEGRKKRISPHLIRGPREPVDTMLASFYDQLLTFLRRPIFRQGAWRLLECQPAWDDNWTHDDFVAFSWETAQGEMATVIVNYAPNRSQCYVRLPFERLRAKNITLRELSGSATYSRSGDDLVDRGLYVDLPAWGYHVFEIVRAEANVSSS